MDRLPAHGATRVELDGPEEPAVGSPDRRRATSSARSGLALVKRTVPVEATMLAGGVAAAQEVVVPPDSGANVQVTLRRRNLI